MNAHQPLRVTVCELPDEPAEFERAWESLVAHIRQENSELVLLPEMPFASWFARSPEYDPAVWQAAVSRHAAWLERLADLAPAAVLSSRPVDQDTLRLNEGFLWEPQGGYQTAHHKRNLPDEEGYYEARWYQPGYGDFCPIFMNKISIGFAICTELWFMQHARAYGRQLAQLLVTPRTTGTASVEKWLTGGRAAAIIAGAYSLSSNRVSPPNAPVPFGGGGWIVGPDGDVLGTTSAERPSLTLEIDLAEAEKAKGTYPRYVVE